MAREMASGGGVRESPSEHRSIDVLYRSSVKCLLYFFVELIFAISLSRDQLLSWGEQSSWERRLIGTLFYFPRGCFNTASTHVNIFLERRSIDASKVIASMSMLNAPTLQTHTDIHLEDLGTNSKLR